MFHPFKHFCTITKHRHVVLIHCIKAGIPIQGLLHDLSKYSFPEFIPGAKYYTGKASPQVGERLEFGYSAAWLHHKGRNKHHFEYWLDTTYPAKMPKKYVMEMFCDRVAAGKVYNKENFKQEDPYYYFERSKNKIERLMHPETMALLEKLLTMYKDKGEKETFFYMRKALKKDKNY